MPTQSPNTVRSRGRARSASASGKAWPRLGLEGSPVAQDAHVVGTAALDLDRSLPLNIHHAVPRCAARSAAAFGNNGVEVSLPSPWSNTMAQTLSLLLQPLDFVSYDGA
jgi:hypothetical protein